MTVGDVAASLDFWHLGHFAADYRNAFSEAPSEPLKNQEHQALIEELQELLINEMTPLDALTWISHQKEKLQSVHKD